MEKRIKYELPIVISVGIDTNSNIIYRKNWERGTKNAQGGRNMLRGGAKKFSACISNRSINFAPPLAEILYTPLCIDIIYIHICIPKKYLIWPTYGAKGGNVPLTPLSPAPGCTISLRITYTLIRFHVHYRRQGFDANKEKWNI